ncbi:hypothetical protein [Streptomyces sp. SID3343]|uniref:hypothetical protein n=1 Tax=Streptomyces sp. SID3343 TaxID=2690260 RepID=UPI00136A0A49|nr:hypothetical protein [Streptomyces sp. SID3343]MYW01239.1 hypothetical protein [Streptomyces sp. SID3343]
MWDEAAREAVAWTWEHEPGAEHVVGGLAPRVRADVDAFAQRLADAATVRYVGDPTDHDSGVSGIRDHADGRLIIGYLEHRRLAVVLALRVQHRPDPETA